MIVYHKSRRIGLTLLELLIASILTVLLLTTMIGFFRAMTLQEKLSSSLASDTTGLHLLSYQLEADCLNARYYQNVSGGIVLNGYLSRHDRSGVSTFRSTRVRYLIDRELDCLVRYEDSVTEAGKTTRQPLFSKVAGIHITPIVEAVDQGLGRGPEPTGMKKMPSWYSVEIVDVTNTNLLEQIHSH